MNDEKAKPSYWAVLPAKVRYDEALTASAKLLYAEISSLTEQAGYCFAKNEYFLDLFGISERTLQRLLKSLEARGFVRIEDGDGGAGRRKIYAGINPLHNPDKNDGVASEPRQECRGNPDKNDGVPYKNKKSNKDPPIVPQGTVRKGSPPDYEPELFESFWRSFPPMSDGHKPAKARARKAWNKLRPDRSTIQAMATALKLQKESELWKRGIGIPYASTWLNGRMWEEEIVVDVLRHGGDGAPSERRDMQWL